MSLFTDNLPGSTNGLFATAHVIEVEIAVTVTKDKGGGRNNPPAPCVLFFLGVIFSLNQTNQGCMTDKLSIEAEDLFVRSAMKPDP